VALLFSGRRMVTIDRATDHTDPVKILQSCLSNCSGASEKDYC
jgi:hypothetical protein